MQKSCYFLSYLFFGTLDDLRHWPKSNIWRWHVLNGSFDPFYSTHGPIHPTDANYLRYEFGLNLRLQSPQKICETEIFTWRRPRAWVNIHSAMHHEAFFLFSVENKSRTNHLRRPFCVNMFFPQFFFCNHYEAVLTWKRIWPVTPLVSTALM